MDVNNTPYFLLRNADEFVNSSAQLYWNNAQQALTLAQNQELYLPSVTSDEALLAWHDSTPLVMDSFHQVGQLDSGRTTVQFNSGHGLSELQDKNRNLITAPVGTFTDLVIGGDGRLALPFSDNTTHGLVIFHLAHRWQTQCDLSQDNEGLNLSAPRRAWVDSDNQIWLVTANHLLLCSGEPLPLPYVSLPVNFEPETINPHKLHLKWAVNIGDWQPLALCGDDTTLYLLVHDDSGKQAILTRPRSSRADCEFKVHLCANVIPFVIDLALASDSSHPVPGRLAALAPKEQGDSNFTRRDAVILELHWDATANSGSVELVRERYPMLSLAVPRFVSSADGQLRYQADTDPDYPSYQPRPRELHALRRPQYELEGSALLPLVLDSARPDTLWHRLYLEATIPAGCAIEIGVKVYNTPEQAAETPVIAQLSPTWNPLPSELGFAESHAPCKPGVSGLFETLLQLRDGPVRRLTGRYLQLHITLRGDGRQTPVLYAIRVYYPRFSYQEHYFPELYRQELSFDPTNATGAANGSDVRERLLAVFESILTPIEGRIAASEQLIHPDATPANNLPWLSEILGTPLPTYWPEARRRRLVSQTTLLQQYKGTLYGINLALDIVSDGGVQRGEIVVVENFRLRRTMATLLGIDMDDKEHPLTLGTGMSGNSIIGESLILSKSDAREFLALFSPDLANEEETSQVTRFFEDYAHQITVLLHGGAVHLHQQVEEVLKEQLPAHLQYQIFETERPFVLGIAPLLAVDTFIETTPDFRRVTLNDTYLGREGVLRNPAAFSPADINTLGANN